MIAIVLWILAPVVGACEAAYLFFWVTGKWLPWYGDALLGLLQPFVFVGWLVLWLAHYTSMVFPVIR